MLVVDASVLAKALVNETDSQKAAFIVGTVDGLVAPAHCLAEVTGVVARKVRLSQADPAQLHVSLPAILDAVQIYPLDTLLLPGLRLSALTGASVYDCLYVALAARFKAQLLAADRRLIAKLGESVEAGLLQPLNSFNPTP